MHMFQAYLSIGGFALVAFANAARTVTFVNQCGQPMKPHIRDAQNVAVWTGEWSTETQTHTLPGDVYVGLKFFMWDQTTTCSEHGAGPDGGGCTVGECHLDSTSAYNQCNLSAAARPVGFSLPADLTFGGQTRTCRSPTDPQCYTVGEICPVREANNGAIAANPAVDRSAMIDCLMQDNAPGAPLTITYCPGGARGRSRRYRG